MFQNSVAEPVSVHVENLYFCSSLSKLRKLLPVFCV